ncbi:hypothetical protein [Plantactinospora veratri]
MSGSTTGQETPGIESLIMITGLPARWIEVRYPGDAEFRITTNAET